MHLQSGLCLDSAEIAYGTPSNLIAGLGGLGSGGKESEIGRKGRAEILLKLVITKYADILKCKLL